MAAVMAEVVSDVEFAALMASVPVPEGTALAVAVSGGADSMALTLLLRDWAAARRVRLQAFTVDHALRPEAAAEAAQVGHWCAILGVPHEVLRWEHAALKGRAQERARQARYDLLAAACARHEIGTLALAHHQDDQAETVLMRFAKGSGIDGLAGMRAVGVWEPSLCVPASNKRDSRWRGNDEKEARLVLLRPLLSVSKARLVATCTARGQEFVCDPGNEATHYARGRLRQAAAVLAAEGMDAARLADLAARAALANDALADYTRRLLARAARYDPAGYAALDLRLCRAEPEEIQLRVLAVVLRQIGGAAYPPKQEALREVLAALRHIDPPRRTLQGCEIAVAGDMCRVIREYAAIKEHPALAPGQSLLWDGRFHVTLSSAAPDNLTLRPLGMLTHDQTDKLAPGLRQKIGMGRVRATLPTLFHGQIRVGIPGYGVVADYARMHAVTS